MITHPHPINFEKDDIMRGKYKNRAENKAAERTIEQKIADQGRLISKLQTENTALAANNQAASEANGREMLRLRNELHEAVSPELKAAKAQISDLLDELGKVRTKLSHEEDVHNRLGIWALGTLEAQGMTPAEAIEAVCEVITGEAVIGTRPTEAKLSRAGIMAVQRAHRVRSAKIPDGATVDIISGIAERLG